jgi:sortase A
VGLRRRRRAGALRRIAAVLLALALAQAVQGAWIPLKATLAQALLERAWSRSLAAGAPVRPWPWADTRPVARLAAPRLGRSAIVLAGVSGEALAFAPGHVAGSASPGAPGNAVIAGHRDTHFAWLGALAEGDLLVVEDVRGRRTRFAVTGTAVVDARTTTLAVEDDIPRLTLVACWPFGATDPGGPLRYLVMARPPPDADGAAAIRASRDGAGGPGLPAAGDLGPGQPRLSRPTMNSSTRAPIVAMTMAPIRPPAAMPRASNR